MDAEVFAVVEHDDLAAALVIDFCTFHECCHHGIANIVRPETVSVVAQVEALEFLGFGARFEQRIFECLVAVIVVVHLDGDTLLGFVTAVITDNRNASIDFPSLFCGGTSFFEVFHMDGELCIFPKIRLLARFCAFRVVVVGNVCAAAKVPHAATHATASEVSGSVETIGRIEHVVVIDRKCNDWHRNVFIDEIRLRCRICGDSVYKFRTTYNRVLGDLLCHCDLLGRDRREGTVKCATDFTTFLRCKRFNR